MVFQCFFPFERQTADLPVGQKGVVFLVREERGTNVFYLVEEPI